MKENLFKGYLSIALLVAVLILGTVVSFNAVIDPYAMNLAVRIHGINTYKSEVLERVRLLKAYEIRRIKPDSIILGSSRVHIGFRPSNEAWARQAKVRYNAAFDSAKTKEMYYYLMHAQAVHPLKLVILGLDGYHLAGSSTVNPDFDESLLMKNNGLFARAKMALTDLKILTSLDTLKSSLSTLRSQHTGHPVWFAADGQRLGTAFFRRKDSDLGRLTPRGYFDKFERLQIKANVEDKRAKINKKAYHENTSQQDSTTSLDYVRKIIDFCRAHDIDLRIFITPGHVHELEAFTWDPMKKGERNLVKILSEDAARHPDKHAIPLFDFSGYSSITTDPLPPIGSKEELKYYWDYSHIKEHVGDLVLNRVLDADDPKDPTPADFGILITENNIDAVIAKLNADHIAYQQQHPEDIKRFHSWRQDFENNPSLNP